MEVRGEAKKRVKVFRQLRSVCDPLKSQLLPLVRHKETRLAVIEVAAFNVVITWTIVLGIGFLAGKSKGIFGQPFELLTELLTKAQSIPELTQVMLYLILGVVMPMIADKLAKAMRLRGNALFFVTLALAPAFIWTFLFYMDSRWRNWHATAAILNHPRLGALALGAIFWPAVLIATLPLASLLGLYISRRRRELADAQLTHLLIETIAYTEKRNVRRRWQESGFKSGLVSHLEDVALCLERDLLWEIERRREDVVLWFRRALAAKAEAVRQLSRWVLTPKTDTREHLLEQLVILLAASARDDVDSFPMITESRAERRRTIWLRVAAIPSSLFSAALPGAVVWSAHKIGLLKDAWLGYGAIAAILWACVVLMRIIDPSGERLESFKKLSGALHLPGFGSAKEKSE